VKSAVGITTSLAPPRAPRTRLHDRESKHHSTCSRGTALFCVQRADSMPGAKAASSATFSMLEGSSHLVLGPPRPPHDPGAKREISLLLQLHEGSFGCARAKRSRSFYTEVLCSGASSAVGGELGVPRFQNVPERLKIGQAPPWRASGV
jgi:hypothetical protein